MTCRCLLHLWLNRFMYTLGYAGMTLFVYWGLGDLR